MASPAFLGGIGIAGAAGGGILGAIGNIFSGDSNAAMYQYKAGMALLDKQVQTQNANWAVQSGQVQSEEKGLQAGENIAQTKVVQSASGFDVNSGTDSSVRSTQTSVAQYDQNIIRWDAAKTAYGYEVKGAEDTAEASLDMQAASNAKTAGEIGAFGSILGAASSVAGKWLQGSSLGIGSGSIGIYDSSNYGAQPSWV